jgi:Karyopherin (importin) alpha
LCDLLAVADSRIIEVTLDSLENILTIGEMDKEANNSSVNQYALFIEEAQGMEKIFECQSNQNEKVYQKAYNIIEKYYSEEDDQIDDEGVVPQAYGDAFGFGVNPNQQQQNFQF